MKKKILVLSLFLVSISVSFTQAQLLWKVSGNGLKHPSYLFATHNLVSIDYLDSVPELFKAFNETNTVVAEMVMNNIDASAKIQKAALLPNHIKVKDLLNDEHYKLVDAELKSTMKLGLKELAMMNPSLIRTLYEMELYKKRTGFTEDKQSVSYFQLVAANKDKRVVGLETLDQQIKNMFGSGSFERQADILVQTVQHKDSILADMIHQIKLYKAGNLEELVQLAKAKSSMTSMTTEEYTQQIDNRTAYWMTKLPALMKESSCFITLDAIHLGGKTGLIQLLEKAGYKVKAEKR